MQSKAATVAEYLAELPEDRRDAINAIRKVIRRHLPKGYKEGMQYGMIGYFVPHSIYPAGYHCDPKQPLPFASLASQKNHMAIYLMCIYGMEEHRKWFEQAWKATGRKLDMGKGCVRFKALEDVPLEVVGEAISRVPVQEFIEHYERVLKTPGKKKSASGSKAAAKKPSSGKSVTSKVTASSQTTKKTAGRSMTKSAPPKKRSKK